MRNIWIFGGTGFIGKALVKQLSREPKNLLNLLVHKNFSFSEYERFNTVTGNLTNFDLSWFERFPPDIVFHLARMGGSSFFTRKLAATRGNKANERIIDYLKKFHTNAIMIYVSGSLVYGNQPENIFALENSDLNPVSYAKPYFYAEKPWLNLQQDGAVDVRFARPPWIIGPNSWFLEFYWKYFKKYRRIPCYGNGNQLMSVIHIDDCAYLIDILSMMKTKNANLNIFSGKPVTQHHFSKTLAKLVGAGVEMIPFPTVSKLYGKYAANALTSSIPLDTCFPEVYSKINLKFPNLENMFEQTLRFLEDKKRVLSKFP